MTDARRRAVVTGLGLVTCLGSGVKHVWKRLIRGDCGINKITNSAYEKIPCKVAGFVPHGDEPGQLRLEDHFTPTALREMPMSAVYAVVAATEALGMAGWNPKTEQNQYRSGVVIGSGMVDLEEVTESGVTLKDKGYKRVSPHFVPKILINMPAGHISIKFQLKGPNHAASTACTTGLHSIGDAARFIQHGDADVMVAGSTEACIGPLAVSGFARMRALSTNFNDNPERASRPFDKDRDGFVMSEGAGIVVLEELEHAKARGVEILGEILGYGLSGDAFHITSPREDGTGAERCMNAALADAKLAAKHVGYINAHATSTPMGDAIEGRAICNLFRADNSQAMVSSTKGAVGHLLGGAGSVEAVFTILSCLNGIIPPTINLDNSDCDLNHVANQSKEWESNGLRRVALTNSFGFGGTNGSLCIGEYVE